MALFRRASRVSFVFALLSLGLAPAIGQQASPGAADRPTLPALSGVDTSAWLYKQSDIAPDPAWAFGTLANGLRFAVRKNGVPPGQVSIRVRVDAGSLMETDEQRGYAHFIEHLTFRGSQYVPDGEAKRTWQRFGASFGSDTNAQTTPTQTLYKLDLPAATPAVVDESLKILSGMMARPAIVPTSLGAERPVVLAELREQPGPAVRTSNALQKTFFAGQKLADRAPIGTVASIDAATAASVLAFHDRWYRPERTTVIVSGDIDQMAAAQMIVRWFSPWQGIGPKPAEPDFGKPDPAQPATTTLVEPGQPVFVVMGVVRPWHFNDDTILFNQKRMVDTIAARIISRRLEDRARAGGSFVQAGVSVDDVSRSANVTTVNIVPVGDDWATALKGVRGVIADAEARPPSQAEIDREYADYDTIMRGGVETARVEASAKQADDLAEALDIRETTTSDETSYAILKDARAKNMFNPAAVLASTKKIFTGDATRALVNIHQADPTATAKLAAVLKADVHGLAERRSSASHATFASLPRLGAPGRVVSREAIPDLGIDRIVFSNGVRMLLFANTGETGRVYVRVRFGGGYNALPADRQSAAWAGELALVQSGIGKLTQGDLDAMVAGRRIGIDFDVGDDAFSLNGITSPADYPDELRLMAAKLTDPGWDPAPVLRAKTVALTGYPALDASPDGVIARDLDGLVHDGDPRWGTPSRAAIAALTPAAFKTLWAPRLAAGPIEVSVFGDVKADEAIAAVARTLGALPPRAPSTAPPPPVRFPAHVATPVVRYHSGPATQAAAIIVWPTGSGSDGISESRRLDILAQVFTDRLFERLRQAAGASYSPSVQSIWPLGMPGGGRLTAIGQVMPDHVDFFFKLSREIAAELASKPIGQDELDRIVGPYKQAVLRASTGNLFWLRLLAGGAYDQRRIDATHALPADLAGITPGALQETAAKYLRPERDWTMAILPKPGAK